MWLPRALEQQPALEQLHAIIHSVPRSRREVGAERVELVGRDMDGVDLVLVAFLEPPGELLHEPRDGRASDARRLHHAGADPPPRAEGYRLVRLCRPEPAAAVQDVRDFRTI